MRIGLPLGDVDAVPLVILCVVTFVVTAAAVAGAQWLERRHAAATEERLGRDVDALEDELSGLRWDTEVRLNPLQHDLEQLRIRERRREEDERRGRYGR